MNRFDEFADAECIRVPGFESDSHPRIPWRRVNLVIESPHCRSDVMSYHDEFVDSLEVLIGRVSRHLI